MSSAPFPETNGASKGIFEYGFKYCTEFSRIRAISDTENRRYGNV
jgi:hypothetical protein